MSKIYLLYMLNAVKREFCFQIKIAHDCFIKTHFEKASKIMWCCYFMRWRMLFFLPLIIMPVHERKTIDSKLRIFLQTLELLFNDRVRMIYTLLYTLFLNNKNHTWSLVAWNRWWVWKRKLRILRFILPVLEYLSNTIIFTNSF